MRKNSPRKWLHACLDLLPVILIPVFMIYSHRHDVAQDFQVTTQEPIYYESNEVNSASDLIEGHIYEFNAQNVSFEHPIYVYISDYVLKGSYLIQNAVGYLDLPYISCQVNVVDIRDDVNGQVKSYQYTNNANFYFVFKGFYLNSYDFADYVSYTDYQLVKEYQPVVTDIPKDVMTSFMDRFNNTIDNHFNMGNVFNLTGVYDWFNTNIFNGNAPQIIYSVWNIALYELVMDLLFLLYGLFMWFIDMVQHLMDKPFKSIK